MPRTRGSAVLSPSSAAALHDRTNTSKLLSGRRESKDARADNKASTKRKENTKTAPAAKPTDGNVSKKRTSATRLSNVKSQVVPARKVHRPPRLTRQPVRTAVKKGAVLNPRDEVASQEQEAEMVSSSTRRISVQRRAEAQPAITSSDASSGSHDDLYTSQSITGSPKTGTQRVAESVYHSSNIPAATPSGLEHSILVLKSFRRRPRQPSMLTMVKQRLASARSSLAGTGTETAPDDSDDSFDLDDDFLPDAAGTPMHSLGPDSMGTFGASGIDDLRKDKHSAAKRKRASHADEHSFSDVDDILPKHRKLVSQSDEEIDEYQTHHGSTAHTSPDDRVSSTPQLEDEHNASEQYDVHHGSVSAASPIDYQSSPSSVPVTTTLSQSSVYGPPRTQHTPPPQRTTRTAARKAPMSTAVLQSLLPKRRKQVFHAYPLPALSLPAASDEDPRASEDSSSLINDDSDFVQPSKGPKASTMSKSSRRAALQQTSPNIVRTARASRRARNDHPKQIRTYGRNKAHDKAKRSRDAGTEPNDDMQQPGEDFTSMEAISNSRELEQARKKFAEVDEWKMEYENETTEDSRTSSQGWR